MADAERRDAERAARNALIFREANEEIEAARRTLGVDGRVPYVYGCDDAACRRLVLLSPEEYRRARSGARRFVIAAEHRESGGRIVEKGGSYVVVDKEGLEGEIAEHGA